MAKNSAVAIIDFGSSTINVIIAERGVNNTFNILGKTEVEYSGYLNADFLDTSDIFRSLEHAIMVVEAEAGMKILEVFVGVPGEFTTVVLKEPSKTYSVARKITNIEIEELFDVGANFEDNEYVLINRSPIFYKTDSGRMLIDPTGEKTVKLSGQLSYVFASKGFTDIVSAILNQLGIKKIEYISSCLAEGLYLLDLYERDRYAVLVDIGYTTTSVMIIRGDGLLYLKSFAMGGGHISLDLFEIFNIPYPVAEELKRSVRLSFAVGENEKYQIVINETAYEIPSSEAHAVVGARLDKLGALISKCLKLCNVDYPSYIGLKLTGGGVSYIKGAKEYLGKVLGKNLELVKTQIPQYDEPHMASTYALLDLALMQKKKSKKFFDKVFK